MDVLCSRIAIMDGELWGFRIEGGPTSYGWIRLTGIKWRFR